jgi:hypothetical protein
MSSPAQTMGSWVRIPPRGTDVCLLLVCVVLCVGSDLATGLSTRYNIEQFQINSDGGNRPEGIDNMSGWNNEKKGNNEQ